MIRKKYSLTTDREQKLKKVIKHRQPNLAVVIENVWDPHNVSAILRTADSVGVLNVYLIYNQDKFPKIGKKTSGGVKKWMNFFKFEKVTQCYEKLHEQDMQILASCCTDQSKSLYDFNLIKPTALVFGNEHSGLSLEAIKRADAQFNIPQLGFAQSLNVSVAAAVSLYEVFRQRQGKTMTMSVKRQKSVFDQWKSR